MFVEFLEDGGEIAVFGSGVERADGADDPCVEFANRAEDVFAAAFAGARPGRARRGLSAVDRQAARSSGD